eukprot:TRINITY_DN79984_c0_g1_i1.p1 TRINITY_DN79984_c0_g1~~TRINITY_DN79984_c0_g1_i1.p1  ORF type:complete len:309 (-),score=55.16 TRINITY_DN79984_c0_g1_i1:70-996(-)
MVAPGYIIEQTTWISISSAYGLFCISQFWKWRIPEFRERVKAVQRIFMIAAFTQSLSTIVLFIDVRSVHGLYSPQGVVIGAVAVIEIPLTAYILWAREVSRVTNPNAHRLRLPEAYPLWKIALGTSFYISTVTVVLYFSIAMDNLALMAYPLFFLAGFVAVCATCGSKLLSLMRASLIDLKPIPEVSGGGSTNKKSVENVERANATQRAESKMTNKVRGLWLLVLILVCAGVYLAANKKITYWQACAGHSTEVYNPSVIIWLMITLHVVVSYLTVSNGTLRTADTPSTVSFPRSSPHGTKSGSKASPV